MRTVTKPKVKVLATGNKLIAKQMQANAGELLPKHLANLESVLLIQEGECTFEVNSEIQELKTGDTIIVPAGVKHQIEAKTDFKGAHIMPIDIEFEFFSE